jgi:hypothetical protein
MLPLLAFPTQLVWDKFRPARGFSLANPYDEAEILSVIEGTAKKPSFLEIVSKVFGYDAELLADGEGETGREGHHWVAYGRPGASPQLIRWNPGAGKVLVTYDQDAIMRMHGGPWITLQADKDAIPEVMRLIRAYQANFLDSFPASDEWKEIAAQLFVAPNESHGFTRTSITYVIDPDKPGEASYRDELLDYLHSTHVEFFTPGQLNATNHHPSAMLSAGDRLVTIGKHTPSPSVLHIRADEPVPPSVLRLLHQESLADTSSMMQLSLESRLTHEYDESGVLSDDLTAWRESSEAARTANDSRMKTLADLKSSWASADAVEVFFSQEFIYPMDADPAVPLSDPSPRGPRHDLLAVGIELVVGKDAEAKRPRGWEPDLIEALAYGVNAEIVREYKDEVSIETCAISRPHMAVFHGLPVKVEHQLTVRRKELRHGLTFQYAKVEAPDGRPGVVFSRLLRYTQY